MKKTYRKPKLVVHGSIKEITRTAKNPGSSDGQANGSGQIPGEKD